MYIQKWAKTNLKLGFRVGWAPPVMLQRWTFGASGKGFAIDRVINGIVWRIVDGLVANEPSQENTDDKDDD